MNITQIKKALPLLAKAKITALITGHRGMGKSECIKQYCEEQKIGFIDIRLGQMADAGDILGLPEITKNQTTKFMKPSFFPTEGEGVLFLDELNRANKDVVQAVFQLVLDGRINEYVLPEGWTVVCAQNPPTDEYTLIDFDDSAFSDRFCEIKFDPSKKDWVAYAQKTGVDTSIVSFIQDQSDMLEVELTDFSLDKVKASRRSWMAVDRLKKLSPVNGIFKELVMGLVGVGAAGSYFSYLKNYKDKVDALDVLNEFSKVKKLVKKFSSIEDNRTDLINNLNINIKHEMSKIKQLTSKQEKNLVDYALIIPRDLAWNFLKELYTLESFKSTESDSKWGLWGRFDKNKKIDTKKSSPGAVRLHKFIWELRDIKEEKSDDNK